jgi:hypothetical protein
MATQIVMDHTGDTRHHFDANDREAVASAEERFRKLTGAGFTAAVRTATGDAALTRPRLHSLQLASDHGGW